MGYETLGTGITLSDILAIGALVTSALLFWFGYARTRKSEQIKIAERAHG